MQSLSFTEAQEWMRCANDIEYFYTTYVTIQNPNLGSVLFSPYQYQKDIISLIDKNRFSLIVSPRQTGKSITIASYLLHQAIFFADVKIGISANKKDQAKEIIERFKYAFENLPEFLKPDVKEYNKFSVVFDNGSSVQAGATTSSGFRGKSFRIIYLDEFAHIKPNIQEEFWTSLLPTISGSANGKAITKVIISSTPNGTEGLFAQLYRDGINGMNGFAIYETDPKMVPGRDEKFKKEMLQKMTLEKYLQEYECHWISSKGTLVNSRILNNIKTKDPLYQWKEVSFYESPSNKILALSVDVSEGIGQDYSVIQIFDLENLEQIGEFRDNMMNINALGRKIINTIEYLWEEGAKQIYYSVESNSMGRGVLSFLENSTNDSLMKAELISTYKAKQTGIQTTQKTKMKGALKLKEMIEEGKLKINSKKLVTELKFFVKSKGSFAAETGTKDDLVMATVLFMNMLDELVWYEDCLAEIVNKLSINRDEEDDDSNPLPFVV